MTTKVILKKSSVSGKVPTDSDLVYGEVALNFTDGRLYYKDNTNAIKNFVDSDLINTTINEKLAAAGVGDSSQLIDLIQLNSVDSAEVIALIDSDYIQSRETYSTSSELLEAIKLVDGSGSGLNADLLDSQDGTYYLDYNNFTNTPNVLDSADIRNIFSAGGDLTYNSSTGEFSIDVETIYTKANFDSDLNLALSTNAVTTSDLAEGSNLYYTSSRVDSDITAKVTQFFVDELLINATTLEGQDGAYYLDYNNFVNTPTGVDSADIKNAVYGFPVGDCGLVTESIVDAFGVTNAIYIDLMETPLPFNQTKMYDFGSVAA